MDEGPGRAQTPLQPAGGATPALPFQRRRAPSLLHHARSPPPSTRVTRLLLGARLPRPRTRVLRPPPSLACAREQAGPSVRWAGRRADVARDAGRFLRCRCRRRLCLACHPGLYENTRRRAARSPPRVHRPAACTACAGPGGEVLPTPRQLPLLSW